MHNNPDISIIIPVYNAELYLDRCVEGLLKQKTSGSYEVVLVDDGSTDSSYRKMQDWALADNRIKTFSKSNGGAGSARNLGLENAAGRYVLFMDCDDWVEEGYVQHLFGSVVEGKHGLSISGFVEGTGGRLTYRRQESGYYSPDRYHRMLVERDMVNFGMICEKIYDLSVIQKYGLKFPSDVHFSEDLIFLLNYLPYAEYVKFVDFADYHYDRRTGGSLISRYNSFSSELEGYRQYKGAVDRLGQTIAFPESDWAVVKAWSLIFAFRSIKTIYRPGPNYLPRKQRLDSLKTGFEDEDVRLFASQISVKQGIDKIICILFKYRQYALLDLILHSFFALRYSFVGKCYLKNKRN